MQLKSLLNCVQKQPGFVYESVTLRCRLGVQRIDVQLRPHGRSRPICSGCVKKCTAYDRLPERRFQFVPLWAIAVFFLYSPRRCDCPRCGIKVELLPWADGKAQMCTTFAWFLSNWAKALSWKETAARFRVSWQTVFRAVETAVAWGLAHRNLDDIRSIGVDEFAWKKGHKYLVFVYQIDHHMKRLLWIGHSRKKETFDAFFDWFGEMRSRALAFIASDMWRAFVTVIAARAPNAVHVLDRFHVAKLLGEAVDNVRREEAHTLRKKGKGDVLKHARWVLLRNKRNLKPSQRGRLRELVKANLRVVRAYLLKEEFRHFWNYKSVLWAARFFDRWCTMAMRSRLEPIKKVVRTLRRHRALILNWIEAKNTFAMGATEGLNNKARSIMKRAYGFRTPAHAEIALFHAMGKLPEPQWLTHKFW
jgi:transposase